MDEEHIKQRKKESTVEASANVSSMSSSSSVSSSTATTIPNVIQTKEEYFEALRIWLQQVQLQQTAMAYFPYYLAANYQQCVGGTAFFLPPQFPAMFPDASLYMPNASVTAQPINREQQQQQQQQPPQPQQFFVNNLFQPNRNNNYVDSASRNLEGIYCYSVCGRETTQCRPINNCIWLHCLVVVSVIQLNGGYEYVIAPIWKRFVAETIDVLILFVIKLMAAFMIIDIFDVDL